MPEPTHRQLFQSAISVALFVAMGLAILSVRLFIDGKRYYTAAETAQSSSDSWRQVVMNYENAAKTGFPGNPYAHRAFQRLSIMAKSAQMRGNHNRAAYIWEVIRRSAVSQRHVIQPFAKYEAMARQHLSRIKHGKKISPLNQENLSAPSAVWSILIWIGLLAWIIGTSVAIFSKTRRWQLITGGISILGAVLWIVSGVLA